MGTRREGDDSGIARLLFSLNSSLVLTHNPLLPKCTSGLRAYVVECGWDSPGDGGSGRGKTGLIEHP